MRILAFAAGTARLPAWLRLRVYQLVRRRWHQGLWRWDLTSTTSEHDIH